MSYGGGGDPQGGYIGSIRARGALRSRPIIQRALATDIQMVSQGGVLKGWCMRETTGSAGAVIELYDGASAGGQFLACVGLGNGVSQPFAFAEDGITVESGVFAHVVTGHADVILYFQYDTGYA